jgi:hypothetical protein
MQSSSQCRFDFFQLGCYALAHGLAMDDKITRPLGGVKIVLQ